MACVKNPALTSAGVQLGQETLVAVRGSQFKNTSKENKTKKKWWKAQKQKLNWFKLNRIREEKPERRDDPYLNVFVLCKKLDLCGLCISHAGVCSGYNEHSPILKLLNSFHNCNLPALIKTPIGCMLCSSLAQKHEFFISEDKARLYMALNECCRVTITCCVHSVSSTIIIVKRHLGFFFFEQNHCLKIFEPTGRVCLGLLSKKTPCFSLTAYYTENKDGGTSADGKQAASHHHPLSGSDTWTNCPTCLQSLPVCIFEYCLCWALWWPNCHQGANTTSRK